MAGNKDHSLCPIWAHLECFALGSEEANVPRLEREESIRRDNEDALVQVIEQAGEERKQLEAEKASLEAEKHKLQQEMNSWEERAIRFNQELQQQKRNNNSPPQVPLIPPAIPSLHPIKREPLLTPPMEDPHCTFTPNSVDNNPTLLSLPINDKNLQFKNLSNTAFPGKALNVSRNSVGSHLVASSNPNSDTLEKLLQRYRT